MGTQCAIAATNIAKPVCEIAHTNVLKPLAESTQQRNFDHILVRIPIYDGNNKEGFFSW